MSELKVYKDIDDYVGYDETPEEMYDKYEADLVIAELKADYKEACDRLQTDNLIKDEQIAATRYNKYKRCLAMARWCESDRIAATDYTIEKWEFYDKWYNRWLRIAEQFKDKETK